MRSSPACSSAGNDVINCALLDQRHAARGPDGVHHVVVAEHMARLAVERLDALVLVRAFAEVGDARARHAAPPLTMKVPWKLRLPRRFMDAQQPGPAPRARRRDGSDADLGPASRRRSRRTLPTAPAPEQDGSTWTGARELSGSQHRRWHCAGMPTARPAPSCRRTACGPPDSDRAGIADQLAVGDQDCGSAEVRQAPSSTSGDALGGARARALRANAGRVSAGRRTPGSRVTTSTPATTTKPAATAAECRHSRPRCAHRSWPSTLAASRWHRGAARAPPAPAARRRAQRAQERRVACRIAGQIVGPQHIADQVIGVPGRSRLRVVAPCRTGSRNVRRSSSPSIKDDRRSLTERPTNFADDMFSSKKPLTCALCPTPVACHSPALAIARVQQRPQPQRNRLSRPKNPRTNGADRAVHQFCDLFVAQTFDLAQRDRLPEIL